MRLEVMPLAAAPFGDLEAAAARQAVRRFPAEAAGALLAGPGSAAAANQERLLAGGCLAVTTGQQAGLFTGPLFSVHKALSAAALAAELSERRGAPVVPVFWVAGDDHDFAEVNHCAVLAADGTPLTITLRERAADAPLTPMFREPVGTDGAAALAALEAALPPGGLRDDALAWLTRAYTPDRSLAEAYAHAMAELLAPFGVVVCRGWHAALKRAAQPVLLGALEQAGRIDAALAAEAGRMRAAGREVPIDVGDGLTLVMLEARSGRDRLRATGAGQFTTRRSGETFSLDALRALAQTDIERFSANVLLRGAVEAYVIPTVAYVGGPGELAYIAQNGPAYEVLSVPRPAAVPRVSLLLVEPKVDKVLEKNGLAPASLARNEADIAGDLARDALDPQAAAALAELRGAIERHYADLTPHVVAVDPTLEKTVLGARNQALAASHDLEKKLLTHLKRRQETTVGQVLRARAQLFPLGKPQERVVTAASVLARHGRPWLDAAFAAARAEVRRSLEALRARS